MLYYIFDAEEDLVAVVSKELDAIEMAEEFGGWYFAKAVDTPTF
jgi:hypothetical protein